MSLNRENQERSRKMRLQIRKLGQKMCHIPKFMTLQSRKHLFFFFFPDRGRSSLSATKLCRQYLTTMIAILPPTSPTTVIGGFSLAIITAKESILCDLWENFQEETWSAFHLIQTVDWVKWVEKKFCNLGKSAGRITGLWFNSENNFC